MISFGPHAVEIPEAMEAEIRERTRRFVADLVPFCRRGGLDGPRTREFVMAHMRANLDEVQPGQVSELASAMVSDRWLTEAHRALEAFGI